ncbi:hypothetical protein DWY45_18060 [Phocaeicola plebeius]|nr:hypothetical protein DWY45_18060 [Phocaeicola plebeius]
MFIDLARRGLLIAYYLRVKNITLAYSFPKNWVQKAFMKDAKIYLSIENPFTFSSLPKGYDPEVMNIMRLYGIIHLSIENPFTFSSLPKGYDPEVMNIMRLYGIIHIIGQFH